MSTYPFLVALLAVLPAPAHFSEMQSRTAGLRRLSFEPYRSDGEKNRVCAPFQNGNDDQCRRQVGIAADQTYCGRKQSYSDGDSETLPRRCSHHLLLLSCKSATTVLVFQER